MNQTNEKLEKFIHFRVTLEEFERLEKEYQKSPYGKKSDFLRSIYEQHKADENQIKEWEAMIAAGKLSNELNRIGVNFNQLLKAINSGLLKQLDSGEKEMIHRIGSHVYKAIELLSKSQI